MRFSWAIPLLFVVFSETSGRAVARLCVGGRSNDQHLASSEVVFLGRATGQQVVPGPGDVAETETTFEVTSQWKGVPRRQIMVRTCGGPRQWCEHAFLFEQGKDYLVFASGRPLSTSACALTSPSATAGPVVAWLNQRKF
jgi:hypothetical protein